MEQFEIRIRLASTTSPETVTQLAEGVQEFFEDNASGDFLYLAAGPINADDDQWAIHAQDNLNELID